MNLASKARAQIQKFRELQQKYSDFGASDSEIYWKFTSLVTESINGKCPKTPEGVNGWELYDVPGAKKVAQTLTRQADRVILSIQKTPLGEIQKIFEDAGE